MKFSRNNRRGSKAFSSRSRNPQRDIRSIARLHFVLLVRLPPSASSFSLSLFLLRISLYTWSRLVKGRPKLETVKTKPRDRDSSKDPRERERVRNRRLVAQSREPVSSSKSQISASISTPPAIESPRLITVPACLCICCESVAKVFRGDLVLVRVVAASSRFLHSPGKRREKKGRHARVLVSGHGYTKPVSAG